MAVRNERAARAQAAAVEAVQGEVRHISLSPSHTLSQPEWLCPRVCHCNCGAYYGGNSRIGAGYRGRQFLTVTPGYCQMSQAAAVRKLYKQCGRTRGTLSQVLLALAQLYAKQGQGR